MLFPPFTYDHAVRLADCLNNHAANPDMMDDHSYKVVRFERDRKMAYIHVLDEDGEFVRQIYSQQNHDYAVPDEAILAEAV